jgi:hypothetical protein
MTQDLNRRSGWAVAQAGLPAQHTERRLSSSAGSRAGR